MKKILALLVGLLMIANISFAMTGVIDYQSIKGVKCGISIDELVKLMGEPVEVKPNPYNRTIGTLVYPGGIIVGYKNNVKAQAVYVSEVRVQNNPQIPLQPSGITNGMTRAEVISRIGEPDAKHFAYEGNVYCEWMMYKSPKFTNFANLKGVNDLTVYVNHDTNRVVILRLNGNFY